MFIPTEETAFRQARNCLVVYEEASGARLNLNKFVIIPFGAPQIPEWLSQTSCLISESGTVHRYLGAPWGCKLSDGQLHNYCLDQISERLRTWSTKILTFTGRVLLIKHVLQAIPIYHMMFIKTPMATKKKLEQIFKDFLWGFKKEGGRKAPLVAWTKLIRQKTNGGLGFKSVTTHSATLLSRWVLSTLDDPESEWARMFKANLQMATWENEK